jgi:hypothetical protein
VQKATSYLVKFGRIMRTVLIILAIACMVGPPIYSLYDQTVNAEVPIMKTPPSRGGMTAEDMRDEAMEREKMQMDK